MINYDALASVSELINWLHVWVFTPNNQTAQYDYFKNQMDLITETCTDKTYTLIIMGDFNLDENQKNNTQYSHQRYYDLLQLIKFNTWSRLVGNTLKESCLDHIYTNDSTSITNIDKISPLMGDHLIITANIGESKPKHHLAFGN